MKKKIISSLLLCTMITYTMPVFAITKDETIYSKLNNNGDNYKTIVNSHIKNEEQEKMINDISDLLNIKNVNGDEEFKQDGNNLVWNAEGSDIYYQGESQKELPISCSVKYELDGVEISPEELAGKSGKVKIIIEYTNKDEHTVKINGKDATLYTPFVVVCGTIISNDNNRNIEVTNGKIIDDGTKTTVLGISLPGMQESLNTDKIEIPNTIEITMDTTNFELNNIITYVTPKVIEESDIELFDKIDEIYSKVNELQSASKQLENGANTLKQGTDTYNEKSQEFNNAVKQVSAGVSSASENYSKIDEGINLLNKNSGKLESGAKIINEGTQAVETNLNTINEKLGELQTGTKQLQSGEKQLQEGIDQIIAIANNIKTEDSASMKKLQAGLNSLKQASQEIQKGTESLYNGETALKAGTDTLASKTEELAKGTKDLYQATAQISQGAKTLNTGSSEMKKGLNTLDKGTESLAQASSQLTDGANTISEGASELAKGITTFNKEGISTICNYINGELKDVSTRVEKLKELSEQYNNFTMVNDGTKGNVKFIMIMDSIKKEDESKQEVILDNKETEK